MLKIEKSDYINYCIDEGIDFKNRRLYYGALLESYDEFGSDFTWRSVERAIRDIHVLEALDSKKPIELWMSSVGGNAIEMLRLHDVIQMSPCQIKFIGGGYVASSCTWIMCCCDERYLLPNTRILIHDGPAGVSSETPAKTIDRKIDTNEEVHLQDTLNKIYAQNSRMPAEFWNEFVGRDLWLSAEEAIALGLADKILEPKKRGNLRKVRMSAFKNVNNTKNLPEITDRLLNRIYANRNLKIELHIPTEQFDKNIVVENKPSDIEIVEKIPEIIEKPKE
jgi:ATP-dependent Clp protease protease subunit